MRDWIIRDLAETAACDDLDVLAEHLVVYRAVADAAARTPATRFSDLRPRLPVRRGRIRLGTTGLILSGAAAALALVIVASRPGQHVKGPLACCPPVELEVKAWNGGSATRLPDRRLPGNARIALEVSVDGPLWVDAWAVNLEDRSLRALAPPQEVDGPRTLVATDVSFGGHGRRLLVVFATAQALFATPDEVAEALAALGRGADCSLAGRACSVAMYEVEVE